MKMDGKKTASIRSTIRSLHQYIGFFVIGLTVIFCLSGIVLVYRDTDLMKRESLTERTVAPNLKADELGRALHLRHMKVTKEEGEMVCFEGGTYNKTTGVASYTEKSLPSPLNAFCQLHKSPSAAPAHWLTIVYAILLLFLAISSFWMIAPARIARSMGLTVAGVVFAIAVLFLR